MSHIGSEPPTYFLIKNFYADFIVRISKALKFPAGLVSCRNNITGLKPSAGNRYREKHTQFFLSKLLRIF